MEQRDWHRLFGLLWNDFFHGQPVTVEVEMDLSLKVQLLDVVIVQVQALPTGFEMPDGLEGIGRHNLITFKSFRETFDGWALNELVGHDVNYRKQVSEDMKNLLPEDDFRLYAVSSRYPRDLARQVQLTELRAGIYEARHFTGPIRLIVLSQLPEQAQNAILCFFSADQQKREYAARTYKLRSDEGSSLIRLLYEGYLEEGLGVPYTMQDLEEKAKRDTLKKATPEERLEGIPVEKRLEDVPEEEIEQYLARRRAKRAGNEPRS